MRSGKPHGKFSIGKGRKGLVLGRVMTEARTWSGSWSFSIGEKFADLVGFTRVMELVARDSGGKFFFFAS